MDIELEEYSQEIQKMAQETMDRHERNKTASRMAWKPQTVNSHVRRIKSELAVDLLQGKTLKEVRHILVREEGSCPGYDSIYRGWKQEIKETWSEGGMLVYNPTVNKHFEKADIWILTIVRDDSYLVTVAGWVWRKDMPKLWRKCTELKGKKFDPAALCIIQDQLQLPWDLIFVKANDNSE